MIGFFTKLFFSYIVVGKGPYIVFSSGLYGIMPPSGYSTFIKMLQDEYSIILSPHLKPTLKKDLETYCKKKNIEEFIYISHSSFDHTILESQLCKKAFLMDPVSLPEFFLKNRRVYTYLPTSIIKFKFTYKNDKTNPFILPGFSTFIKGKNVETFTFNAGHIDILDDVWADLGRTFRIYSMYDYGTNMKRSNLRKYVSMIIKEKHAFHK